MNRNGILFYRVCLILLCLSFMAGLVNCSLFRSPLYITRLTFLEPSPIAHPHGFDPKVSINRAVEKGIRLAQETRSYIKYNEPEHHIYDIKKNNDVLIDIFLHPELSKTERIDRIIHDLMVPNKIDVLICGQYIEKLKESVNIRPFLIVKEGRQIISMTLTFTRNEFLCSHAKQPSRKVVCKTVQEQIAHMVKELLLKL